MMADFKPLPLVSAEGQPPAGTGTTTTALPPPGAASSSSHAASPPKKKQRRTKSGDAEVEKKKQNPSCDACRARKVKCERDPPLDPDFDVYNPQGRDIPACKHCISLRIACCYAYRPKKRGPPNQYLKKLREAQEQGIDLDQPDVKPPPPAPLPPPLPPSQSIYYCGSALDADDGQQQQQLLQSQNQNQNQQQQHQQHQRAVPSSTSSDRRLSSSSASSIMPPPAQPVHSVVSSYSHPPHSQAYPSQSPSSASGSVASPNEASSNNSRTSLHHPHGLAPAPHPSLPPSSVPSLYPHQRHHQHQHQHPPAPIQQQQQQQYETIGASPTDGLSLSQFPGLSPAAANSPNTNGLLAAAAAAAASYPSFDATLGSAAAYPSAIPHPSTLNNMRGSPGSPFPSIVYSPEISSAGAGGSTSSLSGLLAAPTPSANAHRMVKAVLFEPGASMSSGARSPKDGAPTGSGYRIDSVLPRETAIYIVSLFFDYVWALTPCLHQPTFMKEIATRKEETSPLFFSLLMSTLAATIVQVPKVYIPVASSEVRALAKRCYEASRSVSRYLYDPPSVEMVIIRYFDCIYHFVLDLPGSNHACYGEAQHLAVCLGLHREATYTGLDPITAETRRRIMFLLFTASASMACLLGRPVCFRWEDIDTRLPISLDDEYITAEGYLPQSADRTAVIAGFVISIRIHKLLAEVLQLQRSVRRETHLPADVLLPEVKKVGRLMTKTAGLLEDAPKAFQLSQSFNSAANSPAAGWDTEVKSQLDSFFFDPHSSRESAKDAFLVSQGNIMVTQNFLRFVILQYRDELLTLSGPVGHPARNAAERVLLMESRGSEDQRDAVSIDLLNALHNIPIQSLAVNGPSLVHKVRFVASSLLDDSDHSRINTSLLDFLNILSEIEQNFAE